MSKVVNYSSIIPLTDAYMKLNPHIEKMNGEGWELMSVTIEAIGIQELFILFWKKTVKIPAPIPAPIPIPSSGKPIKFMP